MADQDPITDLKKGVPDAQIKKKYSLSDDDIFQLKQYDYVTSKKGISQDDALEMYPDVSKMLSKPKDTVKDSTPSVSAKTAQTQPQKSVLPDLTYNQKPASDNTTVIQPKTSVSKRETDLRNQPTVIAQQNKDAQEFADNERAKAVGAELIQGQNAAAIGHPLGADKPSIAQTGVVNYATDMERQAFDEKKALQDKNQKAADEFYNTAGGKAYYSFVQSVWKPLVESGGKMIGGAVRLAGDVAGIAKAPGAKEAGDKIADSVVDYFDFDRASKEDRPDASLYTTPTKLQGSLINDGHVNKSQIIPKTISSLTNLATLIYGGEAIGGGKVGLITMNYLNSVEDFRKEGAANGLKGGQLDAYSNTAAGVSSAILAGIPADNPLIGKFKQKLASQAIKDITEGSTVNQAIKSTVATFIKGNAEWAGIGIAQAAATHGLNAAFGIDEHLNRQKLENEFAETLLTSIVPATIMMGPKLLAHYRPSAQEISSLNYAAANQQEFHAAMDKAVQAGTYTPEQAEYVKDNVGKFSTRIDGLKKIGYSDDQAAKLAYNVFKDEKVTQNNKTVADNPILKETVGKEVAKSRDELKNETTNIAVGIPELGTEVTGDEMQDIVKRTPNTGPALLKKVEGNTFKVDEINLDKLYKDEPYFQKRVENFETSDEDPEGLRMPAIVDAEGNVLDGKKRLVQQYVNGEKTATVFKQLKTTDNVETEKTGSEAQTGVLSQEDAAKVPDSQEPAVLKGTLSGISPEDQQKIIDERKAVTTLTPRQEQINKLSQDADKYNNLPKGRLGKERSDGLQLLNDIRIRAKDLGLTYNPAQNTLKNAKGTKVQKRFLAKSNQAITENHTPLVERAPEVQKVFKDLHDASKDYSNKELFFPNDVTGIDGKTLNDSQLNATVSDISNGIPSVQAENYLNEFEKMVKDGHVSLVSNEGERVSVPIKDYMESMIAAKKEVDNVLKTGELPVSDDVINKWLEEQEKEMSDPDFQDWHNSINLEDHGSTTNTQTDSEKQAAVTSDTEQAQSGSTRSKPSDALQQDGESSILQEEAYEQSAGLRPKKIPGRISVDPIIGGEPKDLSKIILDLTIGLKQNLFFSKLSRNALGTYAPSSGAIKIRFNGDLDTTAHEIGHALDDRHDIINDVLANPTAIKELPQFSKHGSKPPKGHPEPGRYRANEGFAEFIRALVLNPKETRRAAPELTKIYEGKVPESSKKVIEAFSNDVRTWAGATGLQIIQSNVQFKATDKPGFLKRLFEKKETNKGFEVSYGDHVAANFINPMRVFDKAFEYVRDVKGIKDVNPEDNPTLLARLLLGIDGKFGQVLKNGMIDGKNNLLKVTPDVVVRDANGKILKTVSGQTKNLKWLLEPFDNVDQHTVENDMKDTIDYMIAERTIELSKRFERDDILTGIGGGIFSDVEVAKKAINEIESGDPERLKNIKEAVSRYREMADDTLKYLVDKGRLSKDQYDKIKEDNTQYVALKRVLEVEPEMEISVYKGSGGKLTSINEPIQKIKGSTKKISNPYVSLLDTIHKSLKEGDRNDVLRAFRDMMVESRSMNSGPVKDFASVGVLAKEGDKEATTIFIDGKAEKWKFNQDIYKALNSLDHDVYRIPDWLKIYSSTLRSFTTQFPTFAVRNWIKDTQARLITSNDKSGIRDLFGNPEDWNALERTGGLNAGYYTKSKEMYYTLMDQAINEVAKNKGFILANPDRLKTVWHKYEAALFKSETSNRVAEYRAAFRQAKKMGYDDYNASLYGAFKSRDMMDFAVAGHVMKIVNQIIPFTNAQVQGLRSAAVRAKQNPWGFIARTALFSILPQTLVWLWNHRDDDASKEYENIPAYQRDMFWNLKLGPNMWVAMPKPYELSLTSAGIDRTMSLANGNKKAFDGYAGNVFKLLSPFDEGTVFGPTKPIVENIANYDSFRDKAIISPYENGIDLSLRNTQTASRLGQLIQKAAGIDARKADYFITSTFSYTGKTALKIADLGRDDTKNKFDFSDFGVVKGSPGYNSAPVQEMMKFAANWNLTLGNDYKKFNRMAKSYFKETDDKDIEKKAKALIDYSNTLMRKWENEGIKEKKQAKAEAKHNK